MSEEFDEEKELSKCMKCGFCKEICPTYKILFIESYSPRGKILILREKENEKEERRKKGKKDKKEKEGISFYCTTCNGCKEKCPLNIDVSKIMVYFRKIENKKGRETPANKRMISNIRKYGNPFGKVEEIKKIPKELYCC
jgi:Fe-S oxidoreductase